MLKGVRDLSGASFIRALIPLPKAPSPDIITLGVRISTHYFFQGHKHSVHSNDHTLIRWKGYIEVVSASLLLYFSSSLSSMAPKCDPDWILLQNWSPFHLIPLQNKGHYPTNSKHFKACSSLTPRDFVLRRNSWPKTLPSLLHNSRALEIDAFEASTL